MQRQAKEAKRLVLEAEDEIGTTSPSPILSPETE